MLALREDVSHVSNPDPISTSLFEHRAGSHIVSHDLAKFGPGSSRSTSSLLESQKYCRELAHRHYENFSIASFLVPKKLRQDFFNVYAYCRWSDDLADEMGSAEESTFLLRWWRDELIGCFAGKRVHPVFTALGSTIDKHQLGHAPFSALLDAFQADQVKNRYETDSQILEYCQGSANPVGRIILKLAKVENQTALALSDSICTGLQIANFCQDIKRDAMRNRIYLPRERWLKHHVDESMFLQAKVTPELQLALSEWCDLAHGYLTSGLALVQQVPFWLARDVQLFARGGMAILRNIARHRFDSWSYPIEVTKLQKLSLLARAIVSPRSTHFESFQKMRSEVPSL
jgi:squalene synthase HpnC